MEWYTFFSGFFCSNNPLRKGFEKLLEKVQLCSRVRPRNDQFHVRGSVDERQFRIPQKEYWQKPSDACTSYWSWMELVDEKHHHVRVTAALLQLQFMFFHDEWMEWVDLANIRTWRVCEYRLKLFDYDAKAFHSFTVIINIILLLLCWFFSLLPSDSK